MEAAIPLAVGAASTGASILGSKLMTKAPPTAPVTALPDPNDPTAIAAKKKQQEDILSRQGRQSTILADDRVAPDTSYKGTVLGN